MKQAIQLLIIGPQNDGCDVPEAWRGMDPLSGQRIAPALPVQGAHADMQRLAALIQGGQAGLSVVPFTPHQRAAGSRGSVSRTRRQRPGAHLVVSRCAGGTRALWLDGVALAL